MIWTTDAPEPTHRRQVYFRANRGPNDVGREAVAEAVGDHDDLLVVRLDVTDRGEAAEPSRLRSIGSVASMC